MLEVIWIIWLGVLLYLPTFWSEEHEGDPGQGGDHHFVRDEGGCAPVIEGLCYRVIQQEIYKTSWKAVGFYSFIYI